MSQVRRGLEVLAFPSKFIHSIKQERDTERLARNSEIDVIQEVKISFHEGA